MFLPPVHLAHLVSASMGEQMIEVEMTPLRAEDAPIVVPDYRVARSPGQSAARPLGPSIPALEH